MDDHRSARRESWDRQVMQACNVKQRRGQQMHRKSLGRPSLGLPVNAAARRSL